MLILYSLSLILYLVLPLIQSAPTTAPTLQPWAAYMAIADRCPMIQHPSAAVKRALTSVLIGQDHVIEIVTKAFERWEIRRDQPLVLVLTGGTGTGKSLTSTTIAEAVLQYHHCEDVNKPERTKPNGYLLINGNEFRVDGGKNRGPSAIFDDISARIASTYNYCNSVQFVGSGGILAPISSQAPLLGNGNAVIVMDEVQKVAKGTMGPIMTMLGENGALTWNGYRYNTAGTVIILSSDFAKNVTIEKLIEAKGKRSEVPMPFLREQVKKVIDSMWSNHGVEMGRYVSEIVPFIPFDKDAIVKIVDFRLNKLFHASDSALFRAKDAKHLWARLAVTNSAVAHITSEKFIFYQSYAHKDFVANFSISVTGARTLFSDFQTPFKILENIIIDEARSPVQNTEPTKQKVYNRMLLVDLVDTADKCHIDLVHSAKPSSAQLIADAKRLKLKIVMTAWCIKSSTKKKTASLFPLYSASSVLIPPLLSGSADEKGMTCAAPGLEAILEECDVSLHLLDDKVTMKR